MKVLLLLAVVTSATNADISEILRGSNAIGGAYYHDTSGHYIHDDSGRYIHVDNPYIHEHIPHDPYEHDHIPPVPYVHVDSPYEHVDVPHQPYEHADNPYVHEQRQYLPPPPPPSPPSGGYHYHIPEKRLQPTPQPFVPPPPQKVVTIAPVRPAATVRPFTVAPTAAARGGGPYRWNLIKTGEHKVEHPEYNLQVGLHPHN
ncbi:hypothetical protein QE152_g10610 [Popillia japonica]|uniref:Uncharacterized protein n=1 Tax=Popillia japonica TaxID=7064 RepID=A0AAW1LVU7_POPJA